MFNIQKKAFRTGLVMIFPLVMAACTVGPDYKRPDIYIPANWKEMSTQEQQSISDNKVWWTSFQDEILNIIVEKGTEQNKDLKIAEARVLEARALRLNAASSLYPQLNIGGTAERGNPGFITQNKTIDLYQGGFDASWEIDLFGGKHRRVEASDAIISGNIAQYRDATISLVAEIVREYVTLREFQNRYSVIQEMAENQRRLMEFSRTKFANGAANTIEVSQAETVYKTMLASLPVFEREITATLYRISVLTGSENDEVMELLKSGKPIPETHAAPVMEAPAAVLSHRPDVTEAESYLMARTALTGVAISELYPKISIASLFGWQNTSLLPGQNLWNLGAS